MEIKQILLNLFSNDKEPSIKRVSGFIGWIVCLYVVVYATSTQKEASQYLLEAFILSAALLGFDSAMNTIKSRWSNRKDKSTEDTNK